MDEVYISPKDKRDMEIAAEREERIFRYAMNWENRCRVFSGEPLTEDDDLSDIAEDSLPTTAVA